MQLKGILEVEEYFWRRREAREAPPLKKLRRVEEAPFQIVTKSIETIKRKSL